MFSRPRPDPDRSNYVVGIGPGEKRTYIHSRRYVRGSMNQARRQLDHLVRTKKTAIATCRKAGMSVARSTSPKYKGIHTIKVARGYFHMEEYFNGGSKEPVREAVYAQCKVRKKYPAPRGSSHE